MIFAADPIQKSRSEDAIIAYTWDHFLANPSQPEWLVRFPMVKASVRGGNFLPIFTNLNACIYTCFIYLIKFDI